MPQVPLIGKVAMPDFNILGAIIGGPQYMSQYLTARDTAQQQQTQLGYNADWARQLEGTPQFAAGTQPRDRPAWDLWATMQGGNPQQSALGTNLLQTGVQVGLQRDMADYQQGLQKQMADYQQKITQQDTTFSADTTLGLYKKEADFQQQQAAQLFQSRLKVLTDPANQNNQLLLNATAQTMGLPAPEAGMQYQYGPGGQFGMSPIVGGDKYRQMVEEVQPVQQLLTNNNQLLDMINKGIEPTTAAWRDTKAWMVLQMKDMGKTGPLDENSQALFNQMIPDKWGDYNFNPANRDSIREMLRSNAIQMQSKLDQLQQKWFIQPGQIPNVARGPSSLPPNAPPVPEDNQIQWGRGPGRVPSGPSGPVANQGRPAAYNQQPARPVTARPVAPIGQGSIWNRMP